MSDNESYASYESDSSVSSSSSLPISPPTSPEPAKEKTKSKGKGKGKSKVTSKKATRPITPSPPPSISSSSGQSEPPSPKPKEKTKVDKKRKDKDDEDHSPPKKRGRPKKQREEPVSTITKPSKDETVDIETLFKAELPEDIMMRLTFAQPQILKKVNATITDLLKIAYFGVRTGKNSHIRVDATDDEGYAVITLRLECDVLLSEEMEDDDDIYFALNTSKFGKCLKLVKNYQTCHIDKVDSDTIELVATSREHCGNVMTIKMKNAGTGEYNPAGLPDTTYKWHIADINVQELQSVITAAIQFNIDYIRFRVFEEEADTFLMISVEGNETTDCPAVDIIQHIRQEEKKSDEDESDTEKDDDEEGIDKVFRATRSQLTNDQIRRFAKSHAAVYDKQFDLGYLNRFLKATEHKCLMTLHLTPDSVNDVGETEDHALIIRYSLGDSSAINYMRLALAPVDS